MSEIKNKSDEIIRDEAEVRGYWKVLIVCIRISVICQ